MENTDLWFKIFLIGFVAIMLFLIIVLAIVSSKAYDEKAKMDVWYHNWRMDIIKKSKKKA